VVERSYRAMFLVGSLWNLAGGVAIIALTGWLFRRQGLEPPDPSAYYYSWIALFMTFGLGYVMIWRNMYENRNLVLLGAIGKLAFAAIFTAAMLGDPGKIPDLFWIPVVGDVVFAGLYLSFLRHARTAPRASAM